MLLPRLKNNGKVELWLNKLQQQVKATIEEKIKTGLYSFEKLEKCAICSSSNFELISERDRYGLFYPVNICRDCGLLFVNPRLNQNSYNEFYRLEYRKLYLGKETPTSEFFQQQYEQGRKIYTYLSDNNLLNQVNTKVLEVGCGAGGILQYFKETGFDVEGIDLGNDYLKFGTDNYKLKLYSTSLKDFKPDYQPDIIIYSHVLEHILDLNKELQLIKKIAHPQTIIYIEVPSLKQMHKGYDLNILKYFHIAHTYHFTLTSLTNLLSKNGFDLLIGNEHIMSVFKPTSTAYNTITNDYEPAISYIKKYEKLRWIYYLSPKAHKYYIGMAMIKALDRFGLKYKVKQLLKK